LAAGRLAGRERGERPDTMTMLVCLRRRDRVTAGEYRAARERAIAIWADISGVAAAA